MKKEKNLLLQCSHCEFSTKYITSMRSHKSRIHQEGKNMRRKCKLCDHIVGDKYSLIAHMRTHTGERPYPCDHPGCNYTAKLQTNLTRHRTYVHDKLKLHFCHICDYGTYHKEHLPRHMLIHEENSPKLKFCDLCPYKTVLAENLRRHKITVHSKARPFKCPELNCDYAGKHEPALKNHLLVHRTDDGWKPKCPWPGCSYRGRIPADIRNHMTVHTKEKHFKCTLCPKAFTAHTTLVNHMCSHTKEIHHRCKLCDFGTAWLSKLKKHYLVYHPTTPRAIKCSINGCFFSSDTEHGLNLHLSIKHAIRGPNYMLQSKVKERERGKERRENKSQLEEKKSQAINDQDMPFKCRETRKCRENKKLEEEVDQKMSLKCRVPRCPIITTDGAAMASHLYIVHDLPRVALDRIGI